jgi:hypothetical protein
MDTQDANGKHQVVRAKERSDKRLLQPHSRTDEAAGLVIRLSILVQEREDTWTSYRDIPWFPFTFL